LDISKLNKQECSLARKGHGNAVLVHAIVITRSP